MPKNPKVQFALTLLISKMPKLKNLRYSTIALKLNDLILSLDCVFIFNLPNPPRKEMSCEEG
jgi:hypothetical protein